MGSRLLLGSHHWIRKSSPYQVWLWGRNDRARWNIKVMETTVGADEFTHTIWWTKCGSGLLVWYLQIDNLERVGWFGMGDGCGGFSSEGKCEGLLVRLWGWWFVDESLNFFFSICRNFSNMVDWLMNLLARVMWPTMDDATYWVLI